MSYVANPQEFSSIIIKSDPPPPYPGADDGPPPYTSVVSSENISFVLTGESTDGDIRRCLCTRTDKPWLPRIIAWSDMSLNAVLLVILILWFVETRTPLAFLWIFIFNFPWFIGAYNLYKSADLNLPASERKELTQTWVIFNCFLLAATGTMAVFLFALIGYIPFLILATMAFLPFLTRLISCCLIRCYAQRILVA